MGKSINLFNKWIRQLRMRRIKGWLASYIFAFILLILIFSYQNCGNQKIFGLFPKGTAIGKYTPGGVVVYGAAVFPDFVIRYLGSSPITGIQELHLDNVGASQPIDVTGSSGSVRSASTPSGNLARSFVQDQSGAFFNTESLKLAGLYPYVPGPGEPVGGSQVGWETPADTIVHPFAYSDSVLQMSMPFGAKKVDCAQPPCRSVMMGYFVINLKDETNDNLPWIGITIEFLRTDSWVANSGWNNDGYIDFFQHQFFSSQYLTVKNGSRITGEAPTTTYTAEINYSQFKAILANYEGSRNYSKRPEDYYIYTTGALFELMPTWTGNDARHLIGFNMSKPTFSMSHPYAGQMPSFQGRFDGIFGLPNAPNLQGWACVRNLDQSIYVDLYVGGERGKGGVFFKRLLAAEETEIGVYTYCGQGSAKHRFAYYLNQSDLNNYAGRVVTAYAVSPDGNFFSYLPLNNAQSVTIPGGYNPNSCAPNPACEALGNCSLVVGTPSSPNQAWQSASAVPSPAGCKYTCLNGYSGALCVTPPAAPVNGSCGSANNGTYAAAPNSGLCSTGSSSAVTQNTNKWLWNCNGSNGGTNASCSANVTAANSCATPFCTNGSNCTLTYGNPTSPNQLWQPGAANCGYICINGYAGSQCQTPPPSPVNGVCGASHGGTFSAQPTSGFCATGTMGQMASNTNGWTWNCNGSNGGTNASCMANLAPLPPPTATGSIWSNTPVCNIPGIGAEAGQDSTHCSVYISWNTQNAVDPHVTIYGLDFGHAPNGVNAKAPWIAAGDNAVFILQDGYPNGVELARVTVTGHACASGANRGSACVKPESLVEQGWPAFACGYGAAGWCQDPPATAPYFYRAVDTNQGQIVPDQGGCLTFCPGQNDCHSVRCDLWVRESGTLSCDNVCE